MEITKIIKHGENEFLMIFYNGQWWYYTDLIAKYLEYPNGSKEINKLLNDEHKTNLKKKGNEEVFDEIREYFAGSENELANKTNQVSLMNEDGLILAAMKSSKPNAKLLVQDMIKVFKVELDKAGLNAMEYLLRIEKDKNILINARTTKYYNGNYIKYTPVIINMAINELVYYKYFPDTKYSSNIKTEQLREVYETESKLKDRDVSQDRYEVGNSILEMLYNYYLFNGQHMSLRKAKYIYVKNNNYNEDIVKMFEERMNK